MVDPPPSEAIVEAVRAWAVTEPGIRAVLIVGSQARSETPADRWSDLDVVLFAERPAELVDSPEWVRRFGPVVLTTVEPTAVTGHRERRVLYADGRDVDFAVLPVSGIGGIVRDPDARNVLRRGHRVVLDKDGALAAALGTLAPTTAVAPSAPSLEEYLDCVGDFWYHVLWTAKKLRRGELWTAKMCCDSYLKSRLLRMLEWDVQGTSGGRIDTWHAGRFLDSWAASEVTLRLPRTFARYDPYDIARALQETGRLFSDLARRVGSREPLRYPLEVEAEVGRLVRGVLDDGEVTRH